MIPAKFADCMTNSSDAALMSIVLALHGQPKAGKSTLAATISKFFPPERGAKLVSLEDLFWCSVDQGATKFAADAGVHIPHELNFLKLLKKCNDNPIEAMSAAVEIVAASPAPTAIFDTLSSWDHLVNVHYQKPVNHVLWQTKKGEQDTQAFYRLILAAHSILLTQLVSLQKNIVLLFHTTALVNDTAQSLASDKASSLPGDVDFKIEVTGKARDMYPKHMDLILALRATEVAGKPGVYSRKVYSSVQEKFQAGSRYQRFVAPVEEPHLGKIVQKVRDGIKAAQAA